MEMKVLFIVSVLSQLGRIYGKECADGPNSCAKFRAFCVENPYMMKAVCPKTCGFCTKDERCSPACPDFYFPVCGSDGKTYSNACVFTYASCMKPEYNIVITHFEECKKDKRCSPICHDIYEPVCGSDGKTYSNECDFEYASCMKPEDNIVITQFGVCKKDVCQLPAVVGFCKAYVPSFFFNTKTGNCERFGYGGCGGNQNRFAREEDCIAMCSTETRPEPIVSGPLITELEPAAEPLVPLVPGPIITIPLPSFAPMVPEGILPAPEPATEPIVPQIIALVPEPATEPIVPMLIALAPKPAAEPIVPESEPVVDPILPGPKPVEELLKELGILPEPAAELIVPMIIAPASEPASEPIVPIVPGPIITIPLPSFAPMVPEQIIPAPETTAEPIVPEYEPIVDPILPGPKPIEDLLKELGILPEPAADPIVSILIAPAPELAAEPEPIMESVAPGPEHTSVPSTEGPMDEESVIDYILNQPSDEEYDYDGADMVTVHPSARGIKAHYKNKRREQYVDYMPRGR